jgi:hypothetical protein
MKGEVMQTYKGWLVDMEAEYVLKADAQTAMEEKEKRLLVAIGEVAIERDGLKEQIATMEEKEEQAYSKGLIDGATKQAILELRGRDKFLTETVQPQIQQLREQIAALKEERQKLSLMLCGRDEFNGDLAQYIKNEIDGRNDAMKENDDLTAKNEKLRKLLWIRHGCTSLYGDDGEMQCSKCRIDFLRDSADLIEKKWFDMAMDAFKAQAALAGGKEKKIEIYDTPDKPIKSPVKYQGAEEGEEKV